MTEKIFGFIFGTLVLFFFRYTTWIHRFHRPHAGIQLFYFFDCRYTVPYYRNDHFWLLQNEKKEAYCRGSGSQTALQHLMGDVPIMAAPTEDVVSGMGGIISEVAQYKNYKNAIGYTFRYYSTEMVGNEEIKLLEIDGLR